MSSRRQSLLPSNSPSKSSLRRSSGSRNRSSQNLGPTTHFADEHTHHHFLPHSPPNQNLEFEEDDDNEEAVEESGRSFSPSQTLPPQSFQPFFTLIEDTVSNEHFHPTVHYIFADDDSEIITEAACRSLEQNQDEMGRESQSVTAPHGPDEEEAEADMEVESRLPRLTPGVKEHYLILDVQPVRTQLRNSPDPASYSPQPPSSENKNNSWTYTVSAAQSLSSDWQILRTNISDAPTIGDQVSAAADDGLMLRIEGRGNTPPEQHMTGKKQEKESVEEMIERFQKRLGEIRQLVDLGEEEQQQQEQQ